MAGVEQQESKLVAEYNRLKKEYESITGMIPLKSMQELNELMDFIDSLDKLDKVVDFLES